MINLTKVKVFEKYRVSIWFKFDNFGR